MNLTDLTTIMQNLVVVISGAWAGGTAVYLFLKKDINNQIQKTLQPDSESFNEIKDNLIRALPPSRTNLSH